MKNSSTVLGSVQQYVDRSLASALPRLTPAGIPVPDDSPNVVKSDPYDKKATYGSRTTWETRLLEILPSTQDGEKE